MSHPSAKLSREVESRLQDLARVPILLVATDYDGTLSPIVTDPAKAAPHREAMVALHNLAILPRTHVTVISGRSLGELARLTGSPGNVHLVGSHGSEFDPDFAARLPQAAVDLRDRLERELRSVAEGTDGCTVEIKPASVALHYRNAEAEAGQRAADRVLELARSEPAVQVKLGKMVVELGVIEADKGMALESIRHRVAASAAIFLGDDVTDEDAFARLRGPDLGIKVGPGETQASLRIDDTIDAAVVLARLAELRAEHLAGSEATPIEKHSMLSDQRTIALVDPNARITWLCAPRIDSPAVFSELLGGPGAGFFAISGADGSAPKSQRYVQDTLVLESRWDDFTLTDYLDCSQGRPIDQAERMDLLRVLEGTGKARLELAPRLDFGRAPTQFIAEGDCLRVVGAIDAVVIHAPGVRWDIEDDGPSHTARAEVDLSDGPICIELRWGTQSTDAPAVPEPERRQETASFWSRWLGGLQLPSHRHEIMRTSAVALRGLVHGPTGAIAAAGTTSLPEELGGVRNWDYRFCWPRDASMSAAALLKVGSPNEALNLLEWMMEVVSHTGAAERLAPLYDVRGFDPPAEAEIPQLSGYAGSRPVRIGNGAARQIQLDVFGPIVDLVWLLVEHDVPIDNRHWKLVEAMAQAVQHRWQEPDHGIWEIRGPLQHHVHSKTMCWVTLDRADKIARHMGITPKADYRSTAEQIRSEVLDKGWNERVKAFTAYYGSDEVDASTLLIGLSGLIDPDDPRLALTVEAIERNLREGPTVYRYLYDDSLPGREGGFHICAMWLVEAYALIGRGDDALALFNAVADLAGPTGLLSEQFDPKQGTALGNHPQAYSHLALIEAAIRLESL